MYKYITPRSQNVFCTRSYIIFLKLTLAARSFIPLMSVFQILSYIYLGMMAPLMTEYLSCEVFSHGVM